jgi:osmotically-inducible protein OsmY
LEEIVKKILFIPAICVLFVSCTGNSNNPNGNSNDYSNGNNQMQSQPSDWDITANVKKNLMSDNSLSSSARMISVTTNNGVVTLTGTVASKEESRKVVRMVKSVSGVTDVDNQLTISNP